MFKTRYYPIITAFIFSLALILSSNESSAQDSYSVVVDIETPDGNVPESETLGTGDTLRLTGLPFPLHKLNGAELYLPEEAVTEDIRIELSLPDFNEISEQAPQEVGFGENIANAIQVNVYVDDELASPYEFDEPVELSLPIPQNLPESIGEDVSQFILAYVDDEGQGIDTEAITTIVRDSVNQFVRAEVGHFSNIAMINEQEPTTSEEEHLISSRIKLEQNYPNPFNPDTQIRFEIPESGMATLKVYDMLGREVTTLVNEHMEAGQHQVTFDATGLASGTYIYRLEAGGVELTRQMSFIK